MKLVYRITLTFMLPLVLTLGLWGWLSYKAMEKKIYDDTDLILQDYAYGIISRKLSGDSLPERFNGVYNTYHIREVSEEYYLSNPQVSYYEGEAELVNLEEFASSRMRRQLFRESDGRCYEIVVSLPVFEQDVLVGHVLTWTVLLFAVLLVAMLVISLIVVNYSLKPFYTLLDWMDTYRPGQGTGTVPDAEDIIEFRRLADTARNVVDRFEHQYAERKLFIGNVSHELQTPLAVCSNRLELILDRPDIPEDMVGELVKLHRSLQGMIRLNKTLLLLTKIENGQFADEVSEVDLVALISDCIGMCEEIYAYKELSISVNIQSPFTYEMNEQMASVLVNNLVRNAFIHSAKGDTIVVNVYQDGFLVSNTGKSPLDEKMLFKRFYQPGGRKEGSTGLGLALSYAVCEHSGMALRYEFSANRHIFNVNLKKSK